MFGRRSQKARDAENELIFLKDYINTFFEQLNIKAKKVYVLMYNDFKRRENVFETASLKHKIKFYKLYTSKMNDIYLSNHNLLNKNSVYA